MGNIKFAREIALKAKERIEAGEPSEEVFSDLRMSKESVEKELSEDERIMYPDGWKLEATFEINGEVFSVMILADYNKTEKENEERLENETWEMVKQLIRYKRK